MKTRNQNKSNIKSDRIMEKKTNITEKDLRVYTEHREHDNSKTHQCQDEERNTGSLQADFSLSH